MIALFLFLTALAIYPASRIQTDFNLEGFFPEDDPVLLQFEELGEEFGEDDTVMLIGFSSDSLFTSDVLELIRSLTQQFESLPTIQSVQSLTNARKIENNDGFLSFSEYFPHPQDKSELETQEIFEKAATMEQARNSILEDPFLAGTLISKDGRQTAFVLNIEPGENTYANRNLLIDEIYKIIEPHQQETTFHTSGIPYYRNQYVNMLNKEIIGYIAISSVLIILLLWYLYRSMWGILFPMIIVWSTLLFTIAIMQLTGGYLEIMSSTIAPILLCVGVADAIHMISKYDDARVSGCSRKESILEMLTTLGLATLMTSITTAIGFASLLSSSVVPMKKFGIYTAAGVMIAYLITIVVLPVMLGKTKKQKIFHQERAVVNHWINRVLERIALINRLYHNRVLLGAGLMLLLFGYFISEVDVNGRVFDDIREDTKIMQDQAFFQDEIGPQLSIELLVNSGKPEGMIQPERIQELARLEQVLLQIPEVDRVLGLHTLLQEVHEVMQDADLPQVAALPQIANLPKTTNLPRIANLPQTANLSLTEAEIAQYLLLLEVNNADELFRLIDFDYQKVRLRAFLPDLGSERINEIKVELEDVLARDFQDVTITLTGTTILSADLTDKIVYSLLWSILIAVAAISLIMAMLFRSAIMVAISMIPNLIPLLITAGVMGLSGVDIKPSTAVIFTIALGIAVDDSIHFLSRFRIEYLRRGAMQPALTVTTIKTGRPMMITSLILIAGFGTLINSDFTSTTMMGLLVCSTIFSALVADLLVLPSLFYRFRPRIFSQSLHSDASEPPSDRRTPSLPVEMHPTL